MTKITATKETSAQKTEKKDFKNVRIMVNKHRCGLHLLCNYFLFFDLDFACDINFGQLTISEVFSPHSGIKLGK